MRARAVAPRKVCNIAPQAVMCWLAWNHILNCTNTIRSHSATHTRLRHARPGAGWTPLHFAYDNGHTHLAELLASKGADESVTNLDGEVPKDRLEVFKRRKELRKKQNAMKLKLLALRKLQTKQWQNNTAKHAPVVKRSQLIRAAAIGNTAEIHRLLDTENAICVADEFEKVRFVHQSTIAECVWYISPLALCATPHRTVA